MVKILVLRWKLSSFYRINSQNWSKYWFSGQNNSALILKNSQNWDLKIKIVNFSSWKYNCPNNHHHPCCISNQNGLTEYANWNNWTILKQITGASSAAAGRRRPSSSAKTQPSALSSVNHANSIHSTLYPIHFHYYSSLLSFLIIIWIIMFIIHYYLYYNVYYSLLLF